MASSVEMVACKRGLSSDPRISAITGSFSGIEGFTDYIITGNSRLSMTPFLHVNLGSKAAIHGYPSTMSSFPMFVMRNCIVLRIPPVCMSSVM